MDTQSPHDGGLGEASGSRLPECTAATSRAATVEHAEAGRLDLGALLRALREAWIAGAGLDVFTPERLPPDHELLTCSNLVTTPHVAFYSEESVHELEVLAAENVAAVLDGRRPRWLVNPEVLALERWKHLRHSSPDQE